jgi:protein SCO1/2
VKFVDTQGRAFTLSDLKGKPVILSPIYAGCPSACIVISRSVKKALSELNLNPETYTVLTFTFDPKEDLADMRGFQQKHQLNASNWRLPMCLTTTRCSSCWTPSTFASPMYRKS